jgi:YggT family protein
MFTNILSFLVGVVTSFFVYLLLTRFHFQWLRVSFRNPIGDFVIATTSWMVVPARRLIRPVGGIDLATLVLAWVIQLLAEYALFSIHGRELGSAPGAAFALFAVLALMELVRFSLHILVFAVVVQAVLSWVNPHTPIGPVLDQATRPFLRPIRRVLPLLGNVDLSPLVLLVLLQVLLLVLDAVEGRVGAIF